MEPHQEWTVTVTIENHTTRALSSKTIQYPNSAAAAKAFYAAAYCLDPSLHTPHRPRRIPAKPSKTKIKDPDRPQ